MKSLILLFLFIFFTSGLFSQPSITVYVSCIPVPIEIPLIGQLNGKNEYGISAADYIANIHWNAGLMRWEFCVSYNDGSVAGSFCFASSTDVGQDPPCLEDANWAQYAGGEACITAVIQYFYFSDGRCRPVPTLSQWGIIILSLGLVIVGVVALKYRGFNFRRIPS